LAKASSVKKQNGPRWDWRVAVPTAILVITTIVMVVPLIWGTEVLGIEGAQGVARILARFADSPFASLVVMGIFTALGMTGFPQFLLIGGTVAIFGPWLGFLYSWLATMVSSTLGFWLGRASGGAMLRRYGGPKIQRTSEILGERGMFASFIVRLVPSGPAVVVNMIAGISHIRLWQFLVGTALGIIPKTAVIAFAGAKILDVIRSRNPWELAAGAVVLGLWVAVGIWVRRRYFDRRAKPPAQGVAAAETPAAPVTLPPKDGPGTVH
jgi:uncharacterized membrane protein YdjX (TVP38/TMEM64 family)